MSTPFENVTPGSSANQHKAGADLRASITKHVAVVAVELLNKGMIGGVEGSHAVVYDHAYSPRNEAIAPGRFIGRRKLRSNRDFTVAERNDPLPPPGAVVHFFCDQLHHMAPSDLDVVAGSIAVANTILVNAAAMKTGYSTIIVNADSTVSETIVGQAPETYKHRLFDPKNDTFWLFGNGACWLYEQVVREIAPHMGLIWFFPRVRVGIPSLLFRPMWRLISVDSVPIPRPKYWAGARKHTRAGKTDAVDDVELIIVDVAGRLSARMAGDNSGNTCELDARTYGALKVRASLAGGAYGADTVDTFKRSGLETDPMTVAIATAIAGPGGGSICSFTAPGGEGLHAPGAVRETLPVSPAEPPGYSQGRTPELREYMAQAATAAQRRHGKTDDEMQQKLVDVTRAVSLVIGTLQPLTLQEVIEAQTRPAQVARNKQARESFADPQGSSATATFKSESTNKPKPRLVQTVETQPALEYGRFNRPLYDAMKSCFPGFASGRTAATIRESIRALGSVVGEAGLDSGDVSKCDQSQRETETNLWKFLNIQVYPGAAKEVAAHITRSATMKINNGSSSYFTNGAVITGNSDTTVKTTSTTFIKILTARSMDFERRGMTWEAAVEAAVAEAQLDYVFLAAGDDFVSPSVLRDTILEVFKRTGGELTFDELPYGAVKFLNQVWPSARDSTANHPSVQRFLKKFGLFTNADGSLADRIAGNMVAMEGLPLFDPLLRAIARAYGVTGGTASVHQQQYGLWNKQLDAWEINLLRSSIATELEYSYDALEELEARLASVETLKDLAAILPLVRSEFPEGFSPVIAPTPKRPRTAVPCEPTNKPPPSEPVPRPDADAGPAANAAKAAEAAAPAPDVATPIAPSRKARKTAKKKTTQPGTRNAARDPGPAQVPAKAAPVDGGGTSLLSDLD
jgi:hypothetical protein